jgi:hypothetical protein
MQSQAIKLVIVFNEMVDIRHDDGLHEQNLRQRRIPGRHCSTHPDDRRHNPVDSTSAVLLGRHDVLVLTLSNCAVPSHPGQHRMAAVSDSPFAQQLLEECRRGSHYGHRRTYLDLLKLVLLVACRHALIL